MQLAVRILFGLNAGIAFDLRCEVREAMLTFLRTQMPEALVRGRQQVEPVGPFMLRPAEAMAATRPSGEGG